MDGKPEIILIIIIFSIGYVFLNIASLIGKSIAFFKRKRKKLKPKMFST